MGVPELPRIMVAPNGARHQKADHQALPITISETIATAKACYMAGAGGIHAHIRNEEGRHVLDAGLYRELIDELSGNVPGMFVQITTEAVGQYAPHEQRALISELMPPGVSIALREIFADGEEGATTRLLSECVEAGVSVQMILYDEEDCRRFLDFRRAGFVPASIGQILFVLGRYSVDQQSLPEDLIPFLSCFKGELPNFDWALCAFGKQETQCLIHGLERGGKARIGFENSFWNADGSMAQDNAERVRELVGLAALSQ